MVVELQQKTLDTFSNLTQKTTELNKNILDNSNIIIKAINNMNRNIEIVMCQEKITTWVLYLEPQKNLMQTFK